MHTNAMIPCLRRAAKQKEEEPDTVRRRTWTTEVVCEEGLVVYNSWRRLLDVKEVQMEKERRLTKIFSSLSLLYSLFEDVWWSRWNASRKEGRKKWKEKVRMFTKLRSAAVLFSVSLVFSLYYETF